MSERVVVIGSNSFSGSQFVDYALKEGLEVVGISRSKEYHPVFLPYKWDVEQSAFCFHQLDLNHDIDRMAVMIWDAILSDRIRREAGD